LATVEAKEGETNYTFVDKEIKSSENYYYKITIGGTGETFGPAVARPFLSQPAT
jgi:dissimilatory sulfite reductase (desulfoviridin) alpha/beta subunit